jgi:hypothetical protein
MIDGKVFLIIAIASLGLTTVAACGSSPGASTPSGARPPTPTPAVTQVALTATTRSSDGTVAELHLVRFDGSVVASVAIPDSVWNTNLPVVGLHAYFVDGEVVKAVAGDGSLTAVGTLSMPDISSLYSSEVGIAVSPDESQIAYGYAVGIAVSANTYASRVFVEAAGGSPHQLIDDPADAHGFLLPFAWSTRGLWVTHMPVGLGGAGPFLNYQAINPSVVNPTTGAVGPMQTSCRFPNAMSVRPSGAAACIPAPNQPRSVRVTLPDQSIRILVDPAPSLQLGDLIVRSDGTGVALGTSMGISSQGSWSYGTVEVGNSAEGTWTAIGPRGTLPVTWVDANRILVGHAVGDGPSSAFDGVFLLDVTDGVATKIDADPRALGVLPATG